VGSHDNLVKHAFSDVENARGVLATALPAAIVARIDLSSLNLRPGTFVDENLEDRYSDLLYAARISGREALLYLLWEHKSVPEPFTPLQVMRYMVRIWDQHLASLPKKKRGEVPRLPVIVPIVLHHGREGWTAAVTFEEMLDADADLLAALGEHVPRLRRSTTWGSSRTTSSMRGRRHRSRGWCCGPSRTRGKPGGSGATSAAGRS
jgi:hypothetical protein